MSNLILNQDQIHEENEPMKLKQTYIKHLEEPIEKSKDKIVSDIVRITRGMYMNIIFFKINDNMPA